MTDPSKYIFNHTMIRISNIDKSLEFYTSVLGMKVVNKLDFEQAKFSLYFLAYTDSDASTGNEYAFGNSGVLELTYNWPPHQEVYRNGNEKDGGRGFGHICIAVDNLEAACTRFETLGVTFIKKPSDGNMKTIAFITDPDGYWIEIIKRP